MGFFSILGELFGGGKPSAPANGSTAHTPPPAARAGETTSTALQVMQAQKEHGIAVQADTTVYEKEAGLILFREAVLDTKNRLCGYRFLLRSVMQRHQDAHHIDDRDSLFFKLLEAADIPKFAARRIAVVPLNPASLASGRYRFMAGANTIFQLDLRLLDEVDADFMAHAAELRHIGCKLAFTGVSLGHHTPVLLNAADYVCLNLSDYSLLEFQGVVRKLRGACPNVGLIVEGVPTWQEQRMCLALGVKYCLGDFVSSADKDEQQEGGMTPGRMVSIELLNLLRREAELSELSQAVKKDPGITLQLLKWANSPLAGLRQPVASMEQAILVLGREALYRWLTMSIFRIGGKQQDRDEALLEVALTRARFLETLAHPDMTKEARDELFLVGMLSLFETLLSMPMEKILAQLTLPDSVADVLLRSSGPYSRFLRLALVVEKGRTEQIAGLAEALGVSMEDVESVNLSAFNWAQEALGATQQAAPGRTIH